MKSSPSFISSLKNDSLSVSLREYDRLARLEEDAFKHDAASIVRLEQRNQESTFIMRDGRPTRVLTSLASQGIGLASTMTKTPTLFLKSLPLINIFTQV
jgi:hypothetical protein